MSEPTFDRLRQIGYFAGSLRQLPGAYCKLDTNRLTMVHFCVQALDLLGVWEDLELQTSFGLNKTAIIEWIYSLQTVSDDETTNPNFVGFKGGSFLGGSFHPSGQSSGPAQYNHGHIAMTYTALCTLRTLGDDWSRVDREGILTALKSLQLPVGSFQCIAVGSEHDMRFLYCACCISHMLNDWSAVDKEKAVAYVRACRAWDGAFALIPGGEGHGGSTFCATASLLLMNKLDEVLDEDWRKELIHWCVNRQVGGMQGRPNKAQDTCYSYWIGGTLRLLGQDDLLDHTKLRGFVMQCQTRMGGFGKVIGAYPDVLHSYYSMSYLSFSQDRVEFEDHGVSLKELNCTLGFCRERAALFEPLHP
jgi:geranylgeranyl transferase type-1 subunit beta